VDGRRRTGEKKPGFISPSPPATRVHVRGKADHRIPGRVRHVRAAAQAALRQAHPRGASERTVRLTDDAELHRLNNQFREIDKPTDVLSFGSDTYRDGWPRVMPPPGTTGDAEYLGDIIISLDRCAAQAAAGGHPVDTELALLVVHGTLHLLGYDHDTPSRKSRMWSAQSRALESIGICLNVQ
jgi:probable rRNA maturation factor